MAEPPVAPPGDDEAPPVLGRWSRLYLLVGASLAGWILLFWLFSRAFR